jgi:hypothetical protein
LGAIPTLKENEARKIITDIKRSIDERNEETAVPEGYQAFGNQQRNEASRRRETHEGKKTQARGKRRATVKVKEGGPPPYIITRGKQ